MSRKGKRAAVSVLIAQLLLLAFRIAQAQDAPASATVAISLEKRVITQHEPTIIDLTFENPTSQSIDLNLGYDNENVDVRVSGPDGEAFRKPRSVPKEGMQFSEAVHLAPGMESVRTVVLDDWFHLDRVGAYQIDVTLSYHGIPDAHAKLNLTVLPRDETSLVAACDGLLARALDPHSYVDALNAAKALSEVHDSSAVPFLAQAMKRKEFTGLVITALAHLKTQNAIEVLVSASQSSDPEMSGLAQAALSSLPKTAKQ